MNGSGCDWEIDGRLTDGKFVVLCVPVIFCVLVEVVTWVFVAAEAVAAPSENPAQPPIVAITDKVAIKTLRPPVAPLLRF